MRKWFEPIEHVPVETSVAERGAILVDLLHLTDALPPVRRHKLTAPTFRELRERR